MDARVRQWTKSVGVVALCLGMASSVPYLRGQEQGSPPEDMPDHRLVLRVSDNFLNTLLKDAMVDRKVPVRENILGTDVHGTAHIQAQPGVKLVESPDKATFYLTLRGTAQSRSTGYNGPAIIYSRAVTSFTAYKKIVFEPGKGFRGLPPVVKASTTTYVDGFGSVPGGIIGRIVRRRASRQEAAQHYLVQEIARQRAAARIKAGFERTSNERLAKLNQSPELQTIAALLKASGDGEVKYACCTTPHCLQVATAFNGDKCGPIQLPFVDVPNRERAPIEIWMHDSIVSPRIAAGVEVVKTAANAVAPPATENGPKEKVVTVHRVSDWRRVDVTAQPSQLMSLAALLPKPTEVRAKPILPDVTPGAPKLPRSIVKAIAPRVWRSGKHSAEASFVALEGDTVHLHRTSGVPTSIQFAKLSPADQQWIKNHLSLQ
jgi:hypothetical protein